ncbi:DNA-3-methyladenine glycosylase 2 family protein [Nocardiopsis algeriensis]|uniref:DNA-3-methyladenine glycosylase II n=1 Tax=Nocardiopsis algeriensis TaxID=1478215 RepID=A0A841IVE7_9ACTN|nr:DNA-3-methyladenine glycosylase 2 family protein [Nocardiopsis algeriensis]MBB6120181.1 AraC family transcriptional regulator of adaptative response / DNA-3-methyladenine glycosylase II [Nocardiopsis algeriensis]
MDDDQRYRAVQSRDARFDGVFYTAVRTTGIYCRPSCPARTPLRDNVSFVPTAAAAQEAGFRACKRCRPDLTPGSPEWDLRADAVGRAMRLIRDGAVDRGGVGGLASAVGYSERQLGRLLTAELGAGPLALARTERAQTARTLIETTNMPMSDIAFASGFASVRQFNETVRAVFGHSPTEMRGRVRVRPGGTAGAITLRLSYREPADLARTLAFLGERAVPGIEEYADGVYRRTLTLPHGRGTAELWEGENHVLCRLRLTDTRDLASAVRRCRRLLDLDADPRAVSDVLGADPALAPVVRAHPGIRAPGHSDPAELAVRAVLGQQVSVRAARTLAGRIVADVGRPLEPGLRTGGLTHTFPEPKVLAALSPEDLPLPSARAGTVVRLAEAVASGHVDLGPGCDRDETERRLVALRGIGPWTAGYIRMRGLGDPDVFLATDLGVRQGLRKTLASEEAPATGHWSPWRSYATHLMWACLGERNER